MNPGKFVFAIVLWALLALPLLVQCASPQVGDGDPAPAQQASTVGDEAPIPKPNQVVRYLAWFEGEVQTNYETDRGVAERRLAEWEGKVPDVSDTDEYLTYLSVLDASGRSTEAAAKIKSYLAVKPNEKRAVFILGVHYLRAKKKDLAAYFFTMLEKDATFPWKSLVYNNLGMLALEEKNRTLALDYFEKAVRAEPGTAAPNVNLGALYLQSRSYADAERMFRRAFEIDREFEDAVLGLGSALEGQGKFDEAHKLYAEFMDNNPSTLSVVYNDAILLGNRLKQREQATQQMLRYIQRGGKETARAQEIVQSWR